MPPTLERRQRDPGRHERLRRRRSRVGRRPRRAARHGLRLRRLREAYGDRGHSRKSFAIRRVEFAPNPARMELYAFLRPRDLSRRFSISRRCSARNGQLSRESKKAHQSIFMEQSPYRLASRARRSQRRRHSSNEDVVAVSRRIRVSRSSGAASQRPIAKRKSSAGSSAGCKRLRRPMGSRRLRHYIRN